MEVKNCRSCGRLFNYLGGGYILCPVCMEELDNKFKTVKQYIREHPKATMYEISQENDVTIPQIERWVREERLVFSEDSPIGIECENCGATIKSGRFCAKCKDNVARGLGSLYREKAYEPPKKSGGDKAKMRFLDN